MVSIPVCLSASIIATISAKSIASPIDLNTRNLLNGAFSSDQSFHYSIVAAEKKECIMLNPGEILNGITGERKKYEEYLPAGMKPHEFLLEYGSPFDDTTVDNQGMPISSGISQTIYEGPNCDDRSLSAQVSMMEVGRCYVLRDAFEGAHIIGSAYIDTGNTNSVWIGSSATDQDYCADDVIMLRFSTGCAATYVSGTSAWLCLVGHAKGHPC